MKDRSNKNIQQGEMPSSPVEKEARKVTMSQHYISRQREATLRKSTEEEDSNRGL